jgi:hypothetical protein
MKHFLCALFSLAILHSTFSVAYTAPAPVPRTGQTGCWDESGNAIFCSNSLAYGQDGKMQTGTQWPNPRFTTTDGLTAITPADVTSTIVLDKLTGLEWLRDGSTPTFNGSNTTCTGGVKTWQTAVDYVKCLNYNSYLGHNDWRLPNINEMMSMSNSQQASSATWLNTLGFSGINAVYWSSTTFAGDVSNALNVDLSNGHAGFAPKTPTTGYAWPVRSGQSAGVITLPKTGQTICWDDAYNPTDCAGTRQDGELQSGAVWPTQRFTDNGNQTMSDNLTGLIWTKDPKLMVTRNPTFDKDGTFSDGSVTWQHAIDYILKLNMDVYLGFSDWRLPNVNELTSIVNISQADPAGWLTSPVGFGAFASYTYWTSSTYTTNTGDAWSVSLNSLDRSGYGKTGNAQVWPVRGGLAPPSSALSISKSGSGSGVVSSNVGSVAITWNVNNGSASYAAGTVVTLTATPDTTSIFTGWTGACTNASGPCVVTMDAARSVTATFNLKVNGVCNPVSHASIVTVAPTASLCSTGPASAVTGSGPWNWTCGGSNGGTDASCVAYQQGKPAIQLSKTGQTSCWEATGTLLSSCKGSGQDGDLQMGTAWPNPRFTDNSVATPTDLTVTDNLTGLIWTKDANLIVSRNPEFDTVGTNGDGLVTWQHALDYIKKLNTENYLGHSDWRLPNRNEQESLINLGAVIPINWLYAQGFINVRNEWYWASTSYPPPQQLRLGCF